MWGKMININTFLITLNLCVLIGSIRRMRKSPQQQTVEALAHARQRAVALEAALGTALRNTDLLITKLPPGRKIEVKAKRSKSTVMTLKRKK